MCGMACAKPDNWAECHDPLGCEEQHEAEGKGRMNQGDCSRSAGRLGLGGGWSSTSQCWQLPAVL